MLSAKRAAHPIALGHHRLCRPEWDTTTIPVGPTLAVGSNTCAVSPEQLLYQELLITHFFIFFRSRHLSLRLLRVLLTLRYVAISSLPLLAHVQR